MQFDIKTVNKLLGIDESYKAPERMLQLMLDDQKRPEVFKKFLEVSTDLKFDWFHEYFEDEQAERKSKKQDFTPLPITTTLSTVLGLDAYKYAIVRSVGGSQLMKIRVWIQSPNNASFNEDDIIEVPDNISDDELEETARETAFEHIDWGYERVDSDENS